MKHKINKEIEGIRVSDASNEQNASNKKLSKKDLLSIFKGCVKSDTRMARWNVLADTAYYKDYDDLNLAMAVLPDEGSIDWFADVMFEYFFEKTKELVKQDMSA